MARASAVTAVEVADVVVNQDSPDAKSTIYWGRVMFVVTFVVGSIVGVVLGAALASHVLESEFREFCFLSNVSCPHVHDMCKDYGV